MSMSTADNERLRQILRAHLETAPIERIYDIVAWLSTPEVPPQVTIPPQPLSSGNVADWPHLVWDLPAPAPAPTELCEQLYDELGYVDHILRAVLPKLNRADAADVRKHRGMLQRLKDRLGAHHVRPRLARFRQRGG